MSTVLTMVYYKKNRTYAIRMRYDTGIEVETRRTFKTLDGARRFMNRIEADIIKATGSKQTWQDVPIRKN